MYLVLRLMDWTKEEVNTLANEIVNTTLYRLGYEITSRELMHHAVSEICEDISNVIMIKQADNDNDKLI